MARDNTGFMCHIHTAKVSFEIHHVWPKEYHGPDTPSNKIKICPNAHSDIHFLMHLMLTGKPYDLRDYGQTVRYYATEGYNKIMAYAQSISHSIESKLQEGEGSCHPLNEAGVVGQL